MPHAAVAFRGLRAFGEVLADVGLTLGIERGPHCAPALQSSSKARSARASSRLFKVPLPLTSDCRMTHWVTSGFTSPLNVAVRISSRLEDLVDP